MSNLIMRLCAASLAATLLISCSPAANLPNVGNQVQSSSGTSLKAEQLKSLQTKLNDDDTFVDSLDKDAKAALKAQGITLADSEQIKVLKLESKIFMVLDDRNLKTFHSNLLGQAEADKSDLQKQLDAVRAKANSDAGFKAKLLADTVGTLSAEGLSSLIADQVQVVDSMPNTSLLLVAAPGVEINRGVVTDYVSYFFSNLPDGLRYIVNTGLDKIRDLINKTGKKLSNLEISIAADILVLGSKGVCDVTGNNFSCTTGKNKDYWVSGINKFLNFVVNKIEQKISETEQKLAPLKQQLVIVSNEIIELNKQIAKAAGVDKENLQKKLEDAKRRLNEVQTQIKAFEDIIKSLLANL